MIRREDVYKIGRLGKPHGVKGEISFNFDDDIFDREDADYIILDIDGILVPFFIEEYRFKNDETALMILEGIDSQEKAANLTGLDVYFPRELADRDEERYQGIHQIQKTSHSGWLHHVPIFHLRPPLRQYGKC